MSLYPWLVFGVTLSGRPQQGLFFPAHLRATNPALSASRDLCLEERHVFRIRRVYTFDTYDKTYCCLSCKRCLASADSIRFVLFLAHLPRPGPWPLRARLTRCFGKSARNFVTSCLCGRSSLGLWIVFDGLRYAAILAHDRFPFCGTRLNLTIIAGLDWRFGD